jgi:hypothetical protein
MLADIKNVYKKMLHFFNLCGKLMLLKVGLVCHFENLEMIYFSTHGKKYRMSQETHMACILLRLHTDDRQRVA